MVTKVRRIRPTYEDLDWSRRIRGIWFRSDLQWDGWNYYKKITLGVWLELTIINWCWFSQSKHWRQITRLWKGGFFKPASVWLGGQINLQIVRLARFSTNMALFTVYFCSHNESFVDKISRRVTPFHTHSAKLPGLRINCNDHICFLCKELNCFRGAQKITLKTHSMSVKSTVKCVGK